MHAGSAAVEGPAVDIDRHRQRLALRGAPRLAEDIGSQAVLAVHQFLGASYQLLAWSRRPILASVHDIVRRGWERLRWTKTAVAYGRLGIRNAEKRFNGSWTVLPFWNRYTNDLAVVWQSHRRTGWVDLQDHLDAKVAWRTSRDDLSLKWLQCGATGNKQASLSTRKIRRGY